MPTASSTLYCAAIDLGATSGRVIVGTWSKGKLTLKEVHRFPNSLHSANGHDYWDIPGLWTQIKIGLAAAVASLPRGAKLASVGVDTWGVDYVLTNDAGRIVFPTHAYRDARTQAPLEHLKNTRAAYDRIYAATGIPAVFYNSSFQLAETVESCPAITDLATRCLFLPDYFNFLLSGKMANGFSIASTTQLLDVHSDDWSRVALDYFRVPPTWLTTPVKTGTKLGKISPEVGRVLRTSRPSPRGKTPGSSGGFALPDDPLKDTQVIAVPGHDTTCAYDAMPAAADGGDIFLSSGTWSLVGFESDQPLLGPDALTARIANDRTGRGEYRPLVNVIGLWMLEGTMKDFASRPKTDADWAKLIKVTAAMPSYVGGALRPDGSNGGAALRRDASGHKAPPSFPAATTLEMAFAEFGNPPSMKAAIDAQLKRRRLPLPKNLAGYVRLICDSLGAGHALAIRDFEKLSGRTFKRILMVGGGSKNKLLCQATANASGLPVHSFALEGSTVGNLANQLIALGAVKNLAAFRASLAPTLKQTIYRPQ